ncbi:MAG: HNS-dependent expression A [Variovorax paradoxus]|uniref:HNS-dependent expression A n=1 Tax=Variovorax paradoxus TaxID=34073 RepID=A0A2W5RJK2_VARPD|nr:MAG: HNS-dependent expression A [Variovorax paradoxus]
MNRLLALVPALSLSALAATAMAQTPPAAPAPAKPVVKTSCSDYLALDETIKPKFVYFVVGHGKHGKKDAVFDEVAVEKIKPQLDEYCKVNLTKSAYDKVMASSMASEPHGLKAK